MSLKSFFSLHISYNIVEENIPSEILNRHNFVTELRESLPFIQLKQLINKAICSS